MLTDITSDFPALGLSADLVASITAIGYEQATPIQRETIPLLLAGRDVLGQAATGTGKTAAFALPMIDGIACDIRSNAGSGAARVACVRGLVLVPTRELAMQVARAMEQFGRSLRLSVVPIYGGASMDQQIRALRQGADIVVATPGRALDHLRRSTLKLDGLRMLVLDEADEMLDMGFAEDLETILTATPKGRQTALFSATMPARIAAIAQRHLENPTRITIKAETTAAGQLPRVRHVACIVPRPQKVTALVRILAFEQPKAAIVFCRTRRDVETLAESLSGGGHRSLALHGGMEQRQRDQVMQLFRAGKADLLIATDVAARGLDIDHLSHVINFDATEPETYLHRVGRTGRIGREGVAITLVDPRDRRLMRNIEAFTKQEIDLIPVPTAVDLRARQLDATRVRLRDRLMAAQAAREAAGSEPDLALDNMRVVVDELALEFDARDIAAMAVSMAHEGVATRPVVATGAMRPASPVPVIHRINTPARVDRAPVEQAPSSHPRRWSLVPPVAPTTSRRPRSASPSRLRAEG